MTWSAPSVFYKRRESSFAFGPISATAPPRSPIVAGTAAASICAGDPIEQHLEQHHVIGGKTPCRSRRSAALQRQWGRSALVPTSNTSAPPYRSIRAALMVSLVRVDSSSGLFQAGGRSRPHRGCSIGVLTSDQRSRPGVSGAGTPGRVA